MGNNFIDQLILPSDVSSTQTQPQSSQITINSAGMPRGIKRRQATEYRHNPFSRPMEVKHQAPPTGTHLHKKVIWNQLGPVLTWLSRCNRVWLLHSLTNNTSLMFFFNHKCSISRLGIICGTKWIITPAYTRTQYSHITKLPVYWTACWLYHFLSYFSHRMALGKSNKLQDA